MEKLTKKEKIQGVLVGIPLILLMMIDVENSPLWSIAILFLWLGVASIPLIKQDLKTTNK